MLHILTIDGQEEEGAYSVADSLGEKILYIWEEEDDAVRFAMMLEEDGFPEMNILEVEDEVLLKTCEMHEYQYTICLLYTSPSPRDQRGSRMPSSA